MKSKFFTLILVTTTIFLFGQSEPTQFKLYENLGVYEIKVENEMKVSRMVYENSTASLFNKEDILYKKYFLNSFQKIDSSYWGWKDLRENPPSSKNISFYDTNNRIIKRVSKKIKTNKIQSITFYKYNEDGLKDTSCVNKHFDKIPLDGDCSNWYSLYEHRYDSTGVLMSVIAKSKLIDGEMAGKYIYHDDKPKRQKRKTLLFIGPKKESDNQLFNTVKYYSENGLLEKEESFYQSIFEKGNYWEKPKEQVKTIYYKYTFKD